MVNRIAAGEVIERPASAVKELVENAIDAGATRIAVELSGGGRALIAVTDDGSGIAPDQLALAVERHATSKLDDDELIRITLLGFRGEALAALAGVSRLRIISRPRGQEHAFALDVEAGRAASPAPAAGAFGTRVEVRDLFFATPARLKFLKSERAEQLAAREALERLAMAYPEVAFTLLADGRRVLALEASGADLFERTRARLRQLMGRAFADDAPALEVERDGVRLSGLIGLPDASHNSARFQHLFVNRRPVQDRLLKGALRAAYGDLLARDRQPMAALFLRARARGGRRQRPSDQGRGALPRARTGARPPDRRDPAASRRRRLSALERAQRDARSARSGRAHPPSARHLRGPASPRPRSPIRRRSRRERLRARAARRPRRQGARSKPPWRSSAIRSARRAPSCTTTTSWPRPRAAWSWSTSTPPTSGWCTSA